MLVLGDRKLNPRTDYDGVFADPAAFAKKVHLLWVDVGTVEPESARRNSASSRLVSGAKIQHLFTNHRPRVADMAARPERLRPETLQQLAGKEIPKEL